MYSMVASGTSLREVTFDLRQEQTWAWIIQGSNDH